MAWLRDFSGTFLQRVVEEGAPRSSSENRCAERRQEEGTNLDRVGAHCEAGIVDAQHITLSNL